MTEEVRAGVERPLTLEEMEGLLKRHLEGASEAETQANELRARVARGISAIAEAEQDQEMPAAEIEDARLRLAQLQEQLQKQDWKVMLGVGMAFAYAMAEELQKASGQEGWKPPDGSVAHIRLPGICDLTVSLNGHS